MVGELNEFGVRAADITVLSRTEFGDIGLSKVKHAVSYRLPRI